MPTAAANPEQDEISFNLLTNNSGSKVVLIFSTCDRIGSLTTDLSIDGVKSSKIADEEITSSTNLWY